MLGWRNLPVEAAGAGDGGADLTDDISADISTLDAFQ